MVVTYFGSTPVGVQICFNLQTPFDQPFWQKSAQVCFNLQTPFDQPFRQKSGKQWALQLQMQFLAQSLDTNRKRFFLDGASASESDFA